MENKAKLIAIRLVHTVIWLVMAPACVYLLYAGITNTITPWVWISLGLLALESVTLFINGWVCPITPIAMRYTDDRNDNFDIYLPKILARYNKQIFGTILAAGIALLLYNALGAALTR